VRCFGRGAAHSHATKRRSLDRARCFGFRRRSAFSDPQSARARRNARSRVRRRFRAARVAAPIRSGHLSPLMSPALNSCCSLQLVSVLGQRSSTCRIISSASAPFWKHAGFRYSVHSRMARGLSTWPGDPARLLAVAGPEFDDVCSDRKSAMTLHFSMFPKTCWRFFATALLFQRTHLRSTRLATSTSAQRDNKIGKVRPQQTRR
jgi:hypothetical protein